MPRLPADRQAGQALSGDPRMVLFCRQAVSTAVGPPTLQETQSGLFAVIGTPTIESA
jgi:hypothetical protein